MDGWRLAQWFLGDEAYRHAKFVGNAFDCRVVDIRVGRENHTLGKRNIFSDDQLLNPAQRFPRLLSRRAGFNQGHLPGLYGRSWRNFEQMLLQMADFIGKVNLIAQ